MSPDTELFFQAQQQDSVNNHCCDCGAAGPVWASVSHGIYISIEAAGVHRSLGVMNSFVLSLKLDRWHPVQLRMMELGGNKRFQDFMDMHGVPKDLPIREKYRTRAAAWYRENLRAEAEGTALPTPLTLGSGHLPSENESDPAWAVLDRVFASLHYNEASSAALRVKAEALKRPQGGLTPNLMHWVCEQLRIILDLQTSNIRGQQICA